MAGITLLNGLINGKLGVITQLIGAIHNIYIYTFTVYLYVNSFFHGPILVYHSWNIWDPVMAQLAGRSMAQNETKNPKEWATRFQNRVFKKSRKVVPYIFFSIDSNNQTCKILKDSLFKTLSFPLAKVVWPDAWTSNSDWSYLNYEVITSWRSKATQAGWSS